MNGIALFKVCAVAVWLVLLRQAPGWSLGWTAAFLAVLAWGHSWQTEEKWRDGPGLIQDEAEQATPDDESGVEPESEPRED